jgi:transcriptional regulator GlxA family with amidase domain
VYRVLQREQFARMLQLAARQDSGNPIAAALTYITANLAEPLTVTTLAERVHLSPSAFTRAFREATGRSPYQFIKELRLDRARQLLVEDRCRVAHVAHTVGYTSTSHFIKEFRSRFGATPRDYADANSLVRELRSLRSVAD